MSRRRDVKRSLAPAVWWILLGGLAACLASDVEKNLPLDVWILSGQSNMQGDNVRDFTAMPECGKPWPGQIYSFPKPNFTWTGKGEIPQSQWIVAKPNVCWFAVTHLQDDESLGPEMAFAKTLITKGVSSHVGFVPLTFGGSSLFLDWSRGTGLVGLLIALVHRAMEAAGPSARLRGMIWVQGEGDATMGAGITHAAMYGENMKLLVDHVRSELAKYNPVLPIIIGVQATTGRDRVLPYIHMVRQHQLELQLPGLLKVDMEGYEMYDDNFTELYGPSVGIQKLHITKQGQCLFGEALANVFIKNKEAMDSLQQAAPTNARRQTGSEKAR